MRISKVRRREIVVSREKRDFIVQGTMATALGVRQWEHDPSSVQ